MLKLNFTIGNSESALSDVAKVLDSFSKVLMWIFFIEVVVFTIIYIKKKNAHHGEEKHSKTHRE